MIIFENGFIRLDYDPASDILMFEMPNVDIIVMPEMVRSLALIVEHIRNYDVKKILLDARKTDIWVEEESYAAIITAFYNELGNTRLEKIARLVTIDSVRENVVKKIFQNHRFPFQVQQFTDHSTAVAWLKSSV